MAKFRLKRGVHVEGGKTYYAPNAVIETDCDLMNGGRNRKKFEKLTDMVPITETVESSTDLKRMTVADLRSLAEREGIDLGDAQLKDEIVETIQTAACA